MEWTDKLIIQFVIMVFAPIVAVDLLQWLSWFLFWRNGAGFYADWFGMAIACVWLSAYSGVVGSAFIWLCRDQRPFFVFFIVSLASLFATFLDYFRIGILSGLFIGPGHAEMVGISLVVASYIACYALFVAIVPPLLIFTGRSVFMRLRHHV